MRRVPIACIVSWLLNHRAIARCWAIWDNERRFVSGLPDYSSRANPLALAHFDAAFRFTD